MKLSVRISLLIGTIVLITSLGIIVGAERVITSALEKAIFREITSNTEVNADLLKTKLDAMLTQLCEIATRVRVRSMDWTGIVKETLRPDVSRTDSLEMGLVFPDGTTHYVTDNSVANLGDRDYVKAAFSGKSTFSDVLISRVTNQPVVMLASPVLKNDERGAPVIGALIARKEGGSFLTGLVAQIRTGRQSGYGFLVNNEGTISAHPNPDLVLKQFNPIKEAEKDPSLKSLGDMVATVIKEKSGTAAYVQDGKEMICAFTEIPGHRWLLILTMEKSEVTSHINDIRFTMFVIGGICVVFGVLFAMITGRSIAKPVVNMADTMKDVSKGDLTRRIKL